jgi:hypothetical protein
MLSLTWFSTQYKTKAAIIELIPFVSLEVRELLQTISDIAAPPFRIASKPELPGDVSFYLLEAE